MLNKLRVDLARRKRPTPTAPIDASMINFEGSLLDAHIEGLEFEGYVHGNFGEIILHMSNGVGVRFHYNNIASELINTNGKPMLTLHFSHYPDSSAKDM